MSKKQHLIGAHMSIAGGFYKAIERAESINSTAMQIFTKSNRMWHSKKITDEDVSLFKEAWKNSNIKDVVVHAAYIINIGAKSPETREKSTRSLCSEVKRCHKLGIKYLVIHPGSHLDQGEEEGIKKIGQALNNIIKETKDCDVMILLETAAGQGTNLGYTFEQLKEMYELCDDKKRVGFCFDTCHTFSAGYDLNSEYDQIMRSFDKILGLNKLKVIHVNDSKMALGLKKDRHEMLGKGKINMAVFNKIMADDRLKDIPKILETPAETIEEYGEEIKLLTK